MNQGLANSFTLSVGSVSIKRLRGSMPARAGFVAASVSTASSDEAQWHPEYVLTSIYIQEYI